jgi:hypothetical protein
MARRQAALGQAQMGNVGQFSGKAGLRKMTNMQASANAGRAAQDVQDEISAMSGDYANENQMIEDFYRYSAMTDMTEGEELRYQALMTKLSGSSQGKKALANVARGNSVTISDGKGGTTTVKASAQGRNAMASYATNGDGGVLSAINDKDAFAASYLESVAAQNAAGATVSDFATWGAATDSKGRTNIQAVTEDRLDDNTKLMSQSGDARNDAFTATDASGNHVVTDERINAINSDKDMQAQYADKIQDIFKTSGRNPVTSTEKHLDVTTGKENTIQVHHDGTTTINGTVATRQQVDAARVVETATFARSGQAPIEVVKYADGTFRRKSDGVDITAQMNRYKRV